MAQIVSNRVTSKIKIFNANWFHLSFALFELFPQRLSFCSFWALSVILILSSYAKPSQSQTGITKSETFHARLPQTALLHVLTSSSFSFLFYTGNVMQYFLIALFALIMVLVVLISLGAWFHSLVDRESHIFLLFEEKRLSSLNLSGTYYGQPVLDHLAVVQLDNRLYMNCKIKQQKWLNLKNKIK